MRIGHCAYLTLCEYGVLEQSVLERAAQKALDSCECGVRQRAIFHQLFKDRPTFIRQASDYNLYRGTCEVRPCAPAYWSRCCSVAPFR